MLRDINDQLLRWNDCPESILTPAMILKRYKSFFWNQSPASFTKSFNIWNKIFFHYPFSLRSKNEQLIELVDHTNHRICLYEKRRLQFYSGGIQKRLTELADEYMIRSLSLGNSDVVIDCGANIGEIGLYLQPAGVQYHAFEPSKNECRCNVLNNPKGIINQQALWSSNDALYFYNKNESGDSSVFEIQNYESMETVQAISLDQYVHEHGIQKIKLFKLEAEGAEPEILQGAENSLDKIEYISADCGFERGVEQESTFPQVVNFLTQRGFEVINLNHKRLIVLFQNKRFRQGSSSSSSCDRERTLTQEQT